MGIKCWGTGSGAALVKCNIHRNRLNRLPLSHCIMETAQTHGGGQGQAQDHQLVQLEGDDDEEDVYLSFYLLVWLDGWLSAKAVLNPLSSCMDVGRAISPDPAI